VSNRFQDDSHDDDDDDDDNNYDIDNNIINAYQDCTVHSCVTHVYLIYSTFAFTQRVEERKKKRKKERNPY
jgi:hypothetical protein